MDGTRTRQKAGSNRRDADASSSNRGSGGVNGDHSEPFAPIQDLTQRDLEAAIASVTRALATVNERDQVLDLVRERAALRRELGRLRLHAPGPACERVA